MVGGSLMKHLSGHAYVERQLSERAKVEDRLPLNRRSTGYNLDAVKRHWSVLDASAVAAEEKFLRLDLAHLDLDATSLQDI